MYKTYIDAIINNKQIMKRKRVLMVMNKYNPQIHMGVVKYAHETNWVLHTYNNPDTLGKKYFGEGILSIHGDNDRIVDFIYRNSLPTVDMGWQNSKIKLPQFTVDNAAIGEMGARYFISKGFKSIAFLLIDEDPEYINYYQRFKSFKDYLAKQGIKCTQLDLKNPIPIIESLPKPLAIMAQDDQRALKAQDAFLRYNFRIPEDIAILGVDNDKFNCELAHIPLSSIDSNLFGTGYQAAEHLDKIMDGFEAPEDTVLVPPVKVVERMSTDIFAVNHRNVSKALQEIHTSYKEKLSIDQIAIKAGMSRRRLDDAFIRHLGHSMFDELTKVRLDKAKNLLIDTDLKIEGIANESGFSNLRHMDRIFLRVEKMKPSVFRKQFKKA